MNRVLRAIATKISGDRSDEFITYCDKYTKVIKVFEYKCDKTEVIREIINIIKFYTIYKLYNIFLSDTFYAQCLKINTNIMYNDEWTPFGIVYKNYVEILCCNDSAQYISILFEDGKYQLKVCTHRIYHLKDICDSGNECNDLNKKYGTCRCNDIIGSEHYIKLPNVLLCLNKQINDFYTKTEIIFLLSTIDQSDSFVQCRYEECDNMVIKKDPMTILFKEINKKKKLDKYLCSKADFYCKYCEKIALYNICKNITVCHDHVYIYYKNDLNIFPECLSKLICDYLFY